MAQEPEDPDVAADRLEAALERIAALAAVHPAGSDTHRLEPDLSIPELAERLDSLIGRLRAALGKPGAVAKPDGLGKPDDPGAPEASAAPEKLGKSD
jgi:hypothetical protein